MYVTFVSLGKVSDRFGLFGKKVMDYWLFEGTLTVTYKLTG